jgi:hypothetical protein
LEDTTAINSQRESGTSPRARLGRVRWTICAMLFAATSINYMDRQVIAILKPTLERSIGTTEVSYGYIVDAFQIAYAIGLLAFGRLIDKLGTRISYMLVMAVWSLSAMGHAMASTVLGVRVRALFPWTRRVRQLPARSRPWPNGFRKRNAHWLLSFCRVRRETTEELETLSQSETASLRRTQRTARKSHPISLIKHNLLFHAGRRALAALVHPLYTMRSGCLSHANRRARESRPHRRPLAIGNEEFCVQIGRCGCSGA